MKTVLKRMSLVVAWIGFAIAGAQAAVITQQSATSQVDANGATQVRQDVTANDGFASSVAIWPGGMSDAQGRTAARSRAAEIAANARVFSDTFVGQTFDLALSQAYYAVRIDPVLVSTHMGLDFFLPPSYVEIVNNGETFFNELQAVFFADLRVCQQALCSTADQRFFLQANASGTYRNVQHSILADGDPALDLTPLLNPTVTDTNTGLLRTYLVEFPEFFGHLDLGIYPAGTLLTVEYTLQARAQGIALLSSAIAAVNDPFVVDSDPVRQGPPLTLTATPAANQIPEPSALLLFAGGLLALYVAKRKGSVARLE